MTRTTVTRQIHAPLEKVFATVADIRNFSKAVPHITNVEFLTDTHLGLGTRFRETRMMQGKEHHTELEVMEYVENDKIRIIADTHGTIWDTTFTVRPFNDFVELQMVMDAKTDKFINKMMNRMIKGIVQKAIERDMDAVKDYCEAALPPENT